MFSDRFEPLTSQSWANNVYHKITSILLSIFCFKNLLFQWNFQTKFWFSVFPLGELKSRSSGFFPTILRVHPTGQLMHSFLLNKYLLKTVATGWDHFESVICMEFSLQKYRLLANIQIKNWCIRHQANSHPCCKTGRTCTQDRVSVERPTHDQLLLRFGTWTGRSGPSDQRTGKIEKDKITLNYCNI